MLTEDEARDLLGKAAATIDVGAGEPITEPRRRLWPAVVAAAAVIALVAGAVAFRDSSDPSTPAEPGPDERTGSVLDADQLPSVFAYDATSARMLLESKGLVVATKPVYTCRASGRAVRTEPATGARFQPGDRVTLFVTRPSLTEDCAIGFEDGFAWQFLDFANGRGPAPLFADEVRVYVDGVAVDTLSASEAAKPTNWGDPSALTELRAASAAVEGPNTPSLTTRTGTPPSEQCGVRRPAEVGTRDGESLTIGIPIDGIFRCDLTVDVYRAGGAIDTVVTYTEKSPVSISRRLVPNVVGLTADQARAELESAGFVVETTVVNLPPCHDDRLVLAQSPLGDNTREAIGSVVRLDVNINGDDVCGDLPVEGPDLQSVADSFVEFARGERDLLPIDTPVRLYLGNAYQETISAADAQNRSAWTVCTVPYAERDCPFSAVLVLQQYTGPPAVSGEVTSICPVETAEPPTDTGSVASVVITPVRLDSCIDDFAVQIFANDAGQITAVNLLLGSP